MHMNFNATLILIELTDEYEENDKGVMRCIQRSKEVFVEESLAEYNRLLQCLGYWSNIVIKDVVWKIKTKDRLLKTIEKVVCSYRNQ